MIAACSRAHASARLVGSATGCAKAGERRRKAAKRHGPGRHAAAVDRRSGQSGQSRHVAKDVGDQPLYRMIRPAVAGDRRAEVAGDGDHSRVLAGAVVVDPFGRSPRRGEALRRRTVQRRMDAAFQRRWVEPEAREPPLDQADVFRLARMGGAGKGEFPLADGEAIAGAAFDQSKRLQRLDRGAREDLSIEVPGPPEQSAAGIGYGIRYAVLALHARTPPHQHGNRRDSAVRFRHWTYSQRAERPCSRRVLLRRVLALGEQVRAVAAAQRSMDRRAIECCAGRRAHGRKTHTCCCRLWRGLCENPGVIDRGHVGCFRGPSVVDSRRQRSPFAPLTSSIYGD
jgi:hypothetical protein